MKKLPRFLRSNEFAVIIAMLSVVVQSGHTFKAFISAESLNPNAVDYLFAVLAAAVIDLSIIFYTLRNRQDIAIGAAVVMVALNAYSYWIVHGAVSIQFFAGVLFSLTIPASVYFYSEEIKIPRKSND